uniref:Uncharacterized protein n=1 Tax=Romanomermis culicivorax TaxID=13658 RepID=A0A915I6Y7_ROMCU
MMVCLPSTRENSGVQFSGVTIDGEALELGITVFFVLEPFEQFMVGTHDDLLTVNIVVVHSESVDNGKAFRLHGTLWGFSIGKNAAVVCDYPLIFTTFLVQYRTDGGCTGIGLNDELSWVSMDGAFGLIRAGGQP